MGRQCEFCEQEFSSDWSIAGHKKICQKYSQYIKKNVKEHSRSGKQRETFTCILCDKELMSRKSIFLHLSHMHFRNDQNGTKSQETTKKIVRSAIQKCQKCDRYFMESKPDLSKPLLLRSKLCTTCNAKPFVVSLHSGIRNNLEKQSFDLDHSDEEEVIDVPSADCNSSDDNLDYLDGMSIHIFTHYLLNKTPIIIDVKPDSPITFEVKDELFPNSSESTTSKDDGVDGTEDEDENHTSNQEGVDDPESPLLRATTREDDDDNFDYLDGKLIHISTLFVSS